MTPEPAFCRGCGRKVFFVKDADGKTQILDAVAPVWSIQGQPEPMATREIGSYVSHFSTCPKASEFSRRKKQ